MINITEGRWWRRRARTFLRGITLYRHWGKAFDRSFHNVLHSMPIFDPNSGGSYWAKAPLALRSANESFPLLAELAAFNGLDPVEVEDLAEFEGAQNAAQERLKELFEHYGSDKSGFHN